MIPSRPHLLQNRQTLRVALAAFFAFVATLITSQLQSGLTYHPPFSALEPLSVDFLGWLLTHKIERIVLILCVTYLTKERLFGVIACIGALELPEVLVYYEMTPGHLFDIPICSDTFTVIAYCTLILKKLWQTY